VSRALVILDRQHAGKRSSKTHDLGAWGDLNHDGIPGIEEMEAILTAQYILAAEIRLRELRPDVDVLVMSDGDYEARHQRANGYACMYQDTVYVACHLNAGGGAYGTILHDHRSRPRSGPALCGAIAHRLHGACPELAAVHARPASPSNEWARAFATIGGLALPVGVCFEPAFIDHPLHQQTLLTPSGLKRVGSALADGIVAWLETRS
jgi:N-acetylmuramoyl-L-alanine amidase